MISPKFPGAIVYEMKLVNIVRENHEHRLRDWDKHETN